MFRAYFLFVACSTFLLVLAAGCARNAASPPAGNAAAPAGTIPAPLPAAANAPTSEAANGYAGDAACKSCHPKDFDAQHASNHAHTLRLMDRAGLGKLAPPLGPVPGSDYVIKEVNNVFYLDEEPAQGEAERLSYAFGAGRHGMTYVATYRDNSLMEMRSSYFPVQKQWRATPGLEGMDAHGMGLIFNAQKARSCFGCHVSALPVEKLEPKPEFMGVGCEACHGPAGEHATAMQRKGASLSDLRIERIATWNATRINDMCGRCHRTASPTLPGTGQEANTMSDSKFQPNDLTLSRCFRESRDTLSCATCHNAHLNASHDRRANEAICLRCHSAPGSAIETAARAVEASSSLAMNSRQTGGAQGAAITTHTAVKGKVCPVNARAGCVGCHMPPRKIMPDTMISFEAPDHNIRIYRGAKRSGR